MHFVIEYLIILHLKHAQREHLARIVQKNVAVQYVQRVTILQAPVPVMNSRVNMKYQQERTIMQVVPLIYMQTSENSFSIYYRLK